MNVDITITGPVACGKSHLAQKLEEFLREHALKGTYYNIKTRRPFEKGCVEYFGQVGY